MNFFDPPDKTQSVAAKFRDKQAQEGATSGCAQNTDREIWRETPDDYYANSIHVTQGGGIGINVGGHVIVLRAEVWHEIAEKFIEEREVQESRQPLNDRIKAELATNGCPCDVCIELRELAEVEDGRGQPESTSRKLRDLSLSCGSQGYSPNRGGNFERL